jgi:hypothetical protein
MNCQPSSCTSSPPTSGPSAADAAPPAVKILMATLRSRSLSNVSEIRASDVPITIAPPMPCNADAVTRTPTFGASAPRTEATVNSATPAMKIFRRPIRSDSEPAVSRRAANGSVYAFTIHCRLARFACRSAPIFGSATLTTVIVSVISMAPSEVTAVVQCRITPPQLGCPYFLYSVQEQPWPGPGGRSYSCSRRLCRPSSWRWIAYS